MNHRPTQAQRDLSDTIWRLSRNGVWQYKENFMRDVPQTLADHVAEEVAKANEWQDISTAPKDGRHILLYRPDIQFVGYHAIVGWCMQGCRVIDPPPTRWRPLPATPEGSE